MSSSKKKYAVWAITPNGVHIAKTIVDKLSDVDVFLSDKLPAKGIRTKSFAALADTLTREFRRYDGHVFIMAAGIVVRMIAPLIQSKVEDPAVVVVDDRGLHAVSLLSGHIGGANALAIQIADCIDAHPVITTATDVNQAPAIDVLATEKQLFIENPQAIKTVNMSLLTGEEICVHDPFGRLQGLIPDSVPWSDTRSHLKNRILVQDQGGTEFQPADILEYFEDLKRGPNAEVGPKDIFEIASNKKYGPSAADEDEDRNQRARVYIDDVQVKLPPQTLVLRPPTLMAGIGCNRDTAMQEMKELLERVFEQFHLSLHSLIGLASIRLKADEAGLLALAENLGLPLNFYDRQELNQVKTIENPSLMVEKHVGVKSVCEAAAILAAQNGTLVVPKQTTRNVTIAVARIACTSSV